MSTDVGEYHTSFYFFEHCTEVARHVNTPTPTSISLERMVIEEWMKRIFHEQS